MVYLGVGELERFLDVQAVLGEKSVDVQAFSAVLSGPQNGVRVLDPRVGRLQPDRVVRLIPKNVERLGRSHPLVGHTVQHQAALAVQRYVQTRPLCFCVVLGQFFPKSLHLLLLPPPESVAQMNERCIDKIFGSADHR